MKPMAMVKKATTITLSQPAYEAPTMKKAGNTAADNQINRKKEAFLMNIHLFELLDAGLLTLNTHRHR